MKDPHSAVLSMPVPAERSDRMPRPADAPGFTASMANGWGQPDRHVRIVLGAAEAANRHRVALSERFPGRTIVVGAGTAPVRSNDFYYDFRPHSDFYWLTGASIEDAVLVMRPRPAGGHDAVLHAPPPARPGETGFFSDAQHGELWVGPAPSLSDWSAALGIEVRERESAPDAPNALLGGDVTGLAPESTLSQELRTELAHLRMIKDEWELEQLREAARVTVEGFDAVVRAIPEAVRHGGERWLQGTFDRHARTFGNAPGYATIVGSGHHAPVLHWVTCDGDVNPGDLLLLDMGVELNSFYTADITRTVPISGQFSPAQQAVHDLVEKAHRAGLAQVGPGRRFSDFFVAIMEVIATGLHDWGLIDVSVDEALSPDGQQHRRYLACGVGHHLGLDVHDCAQSTYQTYQDGILQPGMVLTVEPGLYFHAHDLTLPPELRGIGVRIEDDVEVTSSGVDVLSAALPLEATGIEAWLRKLHV